MRQFCSSEVFTPRNDSEFGGCPEEAMSEQKKTQETFKDRDRESDSPVLNNGFMGTPQNSGMGPEDDPDSFGDPREDRSESRELEFLFSGKSRPASKPASESAPKPSAPSDASASNDSPDLDLEALLADSEDDEIHEFEAEHRIVSTDDLVLEEDNEDTDDLLYEEDTEEPLEPLGADFEALFAATPQTNLELSAGASPFDAETQPVSPPTMQSVVAEPRPPATPKPRKRDPLDQVMHRQSKPRRRWRAFLIWAVLLSALAYVAFLPYDFEVGGEFVVQSGETGQVRARSDGEIFKLAVREGDWVESGELMAELSNWDEKRNVALLEAEIERRTAELQTLLEGARPEEIALKEQELASRELKVQFAKAEFERAQQLYKSEAIPGKVLDERRDLLLLAKSEREEAKIALDLLKSGARDSEIAAARAQISQYEKELEFALLQLEQTLIRAETNGQIVSDMSQKPVGFYLAEGALFAEIEDNRVVYATVDVPETEIEEVELGAEVELRMWSDSETRLKGEVYRVSPRAEERDFGKVVRVTVRIVNDEGTLSSGMTGFAKISAEERPVWQAFSRMIVLFFQVELWSWLP